jgi:hypothetical protein
LEKVAKVFETTKLEKVILIITCLARQQRAPLLGFEPVQRSSRGWKIK